MGVKSRMNPLVLALGLDPALTLTLTPALAPTLAFCIKCGGISPATSSAKSASDLGQWYGQGQG